MTVAGKEDLRSELLRFPLAFGGEVNGRRGGSDGGWLEGALRWELLVAHKEGRKSGRIHDLGAALTRAQKKNGCFRVGLAMTWWKRGRRQWMA